MKIRQNWQWILTMTDINEMNIEFKQLFINSFISSAVYLMSSNGVMVVEPSLLFLI